MIEIPLCATPRQVYDVAQSATELQVQTDRWLRSRVGIEPCPLPDTRVVLRAAYGWASLQPLYWLGTEREQQMSRVFHIEHARDNPRYTLLAKQNFLPLGVTEEFSNAAMKRLRLATFATLCKSIVCFQSSTDPSARTKRVREATPDNCDIISPFNGPSEIHSRLVLDFTPTDLVAVLQAIETCHGVLPNDTGTLIYLDAILLRCAKELSMRPDDYVMRSATAVPVDDENEVVSLERVENVIASIVDACSGWGEFAFGHLVCDSVFSKIQVSETRLQGAATTNSIERLSASAKLASEQAKQDGMDDVGVYTLESQLYGEEWRKQADAVRKECEQASLQTKAQRPIITRRLQVLVLYKMECGYRGSATRALTALERSGRSNVVVDFQTLTYRQLTRLWESDSVLHQTLALTSAWGALVFQHGEQMEKWLKHNVKWRGCHNESVLGRFGDSKTRSALVFLTEKIQEYMMKKVGDVTRGPALPHEFESMLLAV